LSVNLFGHELFARHLSHRPQDPFIGHPAHRDLLFYHPLALDGKLAGGGLRWFATRPEE
jgi:hypothetical protein